MRLLPVMAKGVGGPLRGLSRLGLCFRKSGARCVAPFAAAVQESADPGGVGMGASNSVLRFVRTTKP